MSALTDRIAEVLTGFHVDPSDSVCGCYELTPEDAAHVAERVEAELGLTEEKHTYPDYETKAVRGGEGGVFRYGGQTSTYKGMKTVHRWVSAWSEVCGS